MIDCTALERLRETVPTRETALAEIVQLEHLLAFPVRTIHVISDIHGEHLKLRHVLGNVSGGLKPFVDRLTATPEERTSLLRLLYYPIESCEFLRDSMPENEQRHAFLRRLVELEIELLQSLAIRGTGAELEAAFPAPLRPIVRELALAWTSGEAAELGERLARRFVRPGHEHELPAVLSRAVRNLLVGELIVAGDLGDRGPRIDRVIDLLLSEPRVSITWGNHDFSWMGASLGHGACLATVVRFSIRYGRLAQLEEGYGISLEPLETLARSAYANDPATLFAPKAGENDPDRPLAQMQKAAAILQFKLEGQLITRHPEWNLSHRAILHLIDFKQGTITLDGTTYPLKDTLLPTIDPADPYTLSDAEAKCLADLRTAFRSSGRLTRHMRAIIRQGSMYTRRDDVVIFHGCVPVDENGEYLPFVVDGTPASGRALFDALERAVHRAYTERTESRLDLLWYLWGGPLSPAFGKDKLATFESHFIADKHTHEETKNPYFKLLHSVPFCQKILREFDAHPERGLLVNGHVPVKIDDGESPVKDSGLAVTIDGAFSEAYGDKGYTLVLEPERIFLAQHYHFESVDAAVRKGADIVPTVRELRSFDPPRTLADSTTGAVEREKLRERESLLTAFEEGFLQELRPTLGSSFGDEL